MVKHFLLPLMKRKNNSKLNEAVQLPYRLEDFKAGDRVHIIGRFDDVEFNDTGTIVVTSKDVDNPYSNDASFLLAFDEPQHLSHDGDTGIDWIRNRCQNKCWWVHLFQFNSDYNYDDYSIDYDKNRVIKIGEALPDAYDVISSLYESTDLIKENLIYPGIKVGDEVIVSIGDEGLTYGPIINNFATVVDVTEGGTLLVKLKNFNKGHDGNNNIHCGERDCLFLNGSWYEKLSVRPAESLGIPDAYDVISSLYESEDLDWAMDMVNNVNLTLTSIPTEDDGKYYVILFDEPGIKYETVEAIANYIQQKTVWQFTADPDESASTIYNYYKRGWSPYIRLFPGPELNYGDSEDTFNDSTGLYLNNPLVNIIRPY